MSKYELLGLTIGWTLTGFIGLLAVMVVWKIWKNKVNLAKIIIESALAWERIAKDQEEIEQLKMETRAILTRLRAA
jgi:hypothetical protein